MHCPTLNELPSPPPGKTGWPFDTAQDKPWTEKSPQLPDMLPDVSPWPRVSIVTPSYNQVRFIEETIRSVLLQGYPNLEYMIIDGGSTDGSVDIIRKYEPWLAYWVSEPDRGQSHAINKGWKRATGDIIAYLNSDDTYEPGMISYVAQYSATHPEVDMIYSHCFLMDAQSKRLGPFLHKGFNVSKMISEAAWYIPQQGVFIKSDVLLKTGFLDEDLHFNMDKDLFIRIGRVGRVQEIPMYLANYRIHPGAKSTPRNVHKAREEFMLIRQRYDAPFSLKTYIRNYWTLVMERLLVAFLVKIPIGESLVNLIRARRIKRELQSSETIATELQNSLRMAGEK